MYDPQHLNITTAAPKSQITTGGSVGLAVPLQLAVHWAPWVVGSWQFQAANGMILGLGLLTQPATVQPQQQQCQVP
jgi:hypothetical protein